MTPERSLPAVGIARGVMRHLTEEVLDGVRPPIVVTSLPADVVEDLIEGPSGRVIIRGGPALSGHVREAFSRPMAAHWAPQPEGKSPAALARRDAMGHQLIGIAAVGDPDADPWCGEALDRPGV